MLASLLPSPLHPAVVHLPIALTVLLPPFAFGALWAIHKGARPLKAWGLAASLFAALTLSSWVAVETGEQADERVESVVAEAPIETHEEAAEAFLLVSLAVLGVALVGLRGGKVGQAARIAGAAGTLVLFAAGWQVGHSGGALVYQYGAATAYTSSAGAQAADVRRSGGRSEEDEENEK